VANAPVWLVMRRQTAKPQKNEEMFYYVTQQWLTISSIISVIVVIKTNLII
jgi:hypothetical protein